VDAQQLNDPDTSGSTISISTSRGVRFARDENYFEEEVEENLAFEQTCEFVIAFDSIQNVTT
jgi:hypothetical protein